MWQTTTFTIALETCHFSQIRISTLHGAFHHNHRIKIFPNNTQIREAGKKRTREKDENIGGTAEFPYFNRAHFTNICLPTA